MQCVCQPIPPLSPSAGCSEETRRPPINARRIELPSTQAVPDRHISGAGHRGEAVGSSTSNESKGL